MEVLNFKNSAISNGHILKNDFPARLITIRVGIDGFCTSVNCQFVNMWLNWSTTTTWFCFWLCLCHFVLFLFPFSGIKDYGQQTIFLLRISYFVVHLLIEFHWFKLSWSTAVSTSWSTRFTLTFVTQIYINHYLFGSLRLPLEAIVTQYFRAAYGSHPIFNIQFNSIYSKVI